MGIKRGKDCGDSAQGFLKSDLALAVQEEPCSLHD
jgi:hypothetical protein